MNRMLVANTSLGETWWALTLQGSEGLSSLYGFRLGLKSKKSDIDTQALIGEVCSVTCECHLRGKRYFSGHIINASARGRVDDHWSYELLIAPKLWHASRRADFRIFQNQTVQAIADQILQQNAINYEWRLKNSYKTWEYIVQYGETDLAFLLRLFGHEGIYFWFEHNADGEKLILGDHFSTHEPFDGYAAIPFHQRDVSHIGKDHFHAWYASREPESGKYVHTNYDFKQPSKDIKTEFTEPRGHLFDQYEIFAYPGTYFEPEEQYGQEYAAARLHGMQVDQDVIVLEGSVRGVIPGRFFTLTKHPVSNYNRDYIITEAEYRARNNDYESTGRAQPEEAGFHAKISAMPSDRQYRLPPESIRMPYAHGVDTAVVVGPPGSEIHTDEYGRVKVHFHWDRYGEKDGNDSCWIRVSYPWAGSNFGGIQIPRVGQEVIIDYEHGDPQRPLIIGRVYNAKQMPPWDLPANKTQSGLMSRTSPGGGVDNTNAIRFEDAKGKEEMWVRAERDRRLEVKRNETTWIGNDREQEVIGTHVERVRKDIAVSSNANIFHTAGGGILLKAASKIVFEVGASTIEMNAGGTIKISGPQRVGINEETAMATPPPMFSTAADLATPATPADAPASINFSGMQSHFDAQWNNSFPGGTSQEQGGTLVSDASGNLSIANMKGGTQGSFSPDLNVGSGQTVQGVFHTHPYDASEGGHTGVSLSGGDAAYVMNNGHNVIVAQSGTEQFMYMRTDASPASVNATQLNNTQNARMAQLQTVDGKSFSEASKIAAKETAQAYGLAYYEGSNGVFQRVSP